VTACGRLGRRGQAATYSASRLLLSCSNYFCVHEDFCPSWGSFPDFIDAVTLRAIPCCILLFMVAAKGTGRTVPLPSAGTHVAACSVNIYRYAAWRAKRRIMRRRAGTWEPPASAYPPALACAALITYTRHAFIPITLDASGDKHALRSRQDAASRALLEVAVAATCRIATCATHCYPAGVCACAPAAIRRRGVAATRRVKRCGCGTGDAARTPCLRASTRGQGAALLRCFTCWRR